MTKAITITAPITRVAAAVSAIIVVVVVDDVPAATPPNAPSTSTFFASTTPTMKNPGWRVSEGDSAKNTQISLELLRGPTTWLIFSH